jgi:hypothetical protein
MDSFGFAGTSRPCCNGTRRYDRVKNYFQWVSVPVEDVPKLRYRELFRNKARQIMVRDVLGDQKSLRSMCPGFLLHDERPE